MDDVVTWVESTGFHEYRAAFEEADVNGARLLKLTANKIASDLLVIPPEHAAVIAMEISELRARRGLMTSGELRAYHESHPPASQWGVEDVRAFLEDAGLERYVERFGAAQIDGAKLLQLRAAELAMLVRGEPNTAEQNEAAAELIAALVEHLRWRTTSQTARLKEEL